MFLEDGHVSGLSRTYLAAKPWLGPISPTKELGHTLRQSLNREDDCAGWVVVSREVAPGLRSV